MLVLERRGQEVFYQGRKLTIVAQASKGDNKEVVKIEGLEGSNGQKWVSLTKLKEGINEVETQGKVMNSKKYVLTLEETQQIEALQAQIDAIIENAKKRYVPHKDIKEMSIEELENFIKLRKQELANQVNEGL